MFSRTIKAVAGIFPHHRINNFGTSSQKNFKVIIAGSAGDIGQPLSMLMKMSRLVTRLELYDIKPVSHGLGVDLSHMDTPAKVNGHEGSEQLANILQDADLVMISAGVAPAPGMTRDDVFFTNATIVYELVESVAQHAPKAVVTIITNPVNSVVPVAAEAMKKAGVYDPARIIGVTTLDVIRASAFVGEINGVDPGTVTVPVIGGHSGITIVPLLSQCQPPVKQPGQTTIATLAKKIQDASSEVFLAKAGLGSATLSMAYAGARLAMSVLRGLKGEPKVVECAYVESDVTEAPYFANPVLLGKNGIKKNLGFGKLNEFEKQLLKAAIPELIRDIRVGEDFAKMQIKS